jgi:beta-1,4-N-acetylgalactosaminyltransferase 2
MLFGSSRRRRVSQVVTVIMKTFQRPQTAARAVEHLRRWYPEIRLLVGDDSREALAFSHPQAEVIRLPFDCGISRGRNALLERVETEYFLLMDDDHWFSRQTRLGRMLEIVERERFDILACHVWFRRHTERMFPKRRLNDFFLNLRLEGGTFELLEAHHQKTRSWSVCDLVENFFIARTDRVRELGGWDDRLKVSEHADFFIRAKRLGLKVGYTPLAGVDHVHIHKERASQDYAPFRGYRQDEFRRLWLSIHGIQRYVERDGNSLTPEEWIRKEEWGRRADRPRS